MDNDIFNDDDDDSGTAFRDIITLALCGFVAMVVLLLPHINPPGKASAEQDIAAPGNVIVELRWPDEQDADVDLWVQAPGDVPVGYSNKGGQAFNLLRDDLGDYGDATKMNYEVSYSRGITPGEYTVNVHLYRNPSGTLPVPVTAVVSVKKEGGDWTRQILSTEVDLRRLGEEMTAFRFELAEDGTLVPDSVHNLYRPLRSARKE